ncbi:phosphotransferase [Nesterenkonia rhizosphaerae]|uniref:Phosphotransferase n=1 Tax=Nesterenkonia rhizosphaerae TaxID=1348272 RepID=A0ABP9FQG9_9MICC
MKHRENHVFRADTPAGDSYAMKLHRPGYRTDAEVHTELTYLKALAENGHPVPQVLPAADGALCAVVSRGGHTRRVSVMSWLKDAEPFSDAAEAFTGTDQASQEDFAAVGALLARLHRTAESLGTLSDFSRGAWDADGLAGPAPQWGDPRMLPSLSTAEQKLITAALHKVHRNLSSLEADPRTFGMIHADTTPENILRTPNGLMLIDFDDFGTGWYLFDLTTALFHHTRQARYPALRDALLNAYEQVRPLSDAEHEAWDALMLARGLSYLGWAAERPGDEASVFICAHIAPWVLTLADAYTRGESAPSGTAVPMKEIA